MPTPTSSTRVWWWPLPVVATIAAVLLTGCGAVEKKQVCSGQPEHVVVVAATSISDLELSQRFTPAVSKQAVERAATSCGSLSVGLLGGKHAEADLALETHQFTPSKTEVYGSTTPILEPLKQDGGDFVERELLKPLRQAEALEGSPFLNGLARIAAELKTRHVTKAAIVIVGDGVVVERGQDGRLISFGDDTPDHKAVNAFAPLYGPLKNGCVILAGSGAEAKLSDEQLRTARRLLGGVLEEAGAQFVATRGDDIPWGC